MSRYEILPVRMKIKGREVYLETILTGEPDTWAVFEVIAGERTVWKRNCRTEAKARNFIDNLTGGYISLLSDIGKAGYEN